jgi:ethanolamine permease
MSVNPADTSSKLGSTATETKKNINSFHVWALGITVVLGGQYFSWNNGFEAGAGAFIICAFLVGAAYVCLIFSISEISSGLPFAGGSYGLARVSLGFYIGFVVGCCEAIEYMLYSSLVCSDLGDMIAQFFHMDDIYKPVLWIFFFIVALTVQIRGGQLFWNVNVVLALISLTLIIIYCFGSLRYVNFNAYAKKANYDDELPHVGYFFGGGKLFMKSVHLIGCFFVGIDSLAFSAALVDEPKKSIPQGAVSCVLTLFVTCIMIIFITASLPRGEHSIARSEAPLSNGFALIFGVSEYDAIFFSIPATFAVFIGFMFPYGKLLEGMANSKLLPTPFTWTTPGRETPYFAMLAGSAVVYTVCLIVYFFPVVYGSLFDLCILFGFVTNISQCIGYLAMSTRFQSIQRELHSPFGQAGAVFTIMVDIMGILSVVAFHDSHVALYAYLIILFVLTVYYHAYAKHNQTFSEEESKILFVAHVITYNKGKTGHKTGKPKRASTHGDVKSSSAHESRSRFSRLSTTGQKMLHSVGYGIAQRWLGMFYKGAKVEPHSSASESGKQNGSDCSSMSYIPGNSSIVPSHLFSNIQDRQLLKMDDENIPLDEEGNPIDNLHVEV